MHIVHPLAPPNNPVTMYPRRGLEGPHPRKAMPRDTGPNCVVYLEGIAPDPAPAVPDTVSMRQIDEQFVPHVLAIRAGSVVRFPNLDPFFHNVFSYSRPKRFDLGKYPSGQSRSVRFATPGVIQVFCEIHEFMSAYIFVLPHSYFAVPAPDGHYVIENVPPGRYRLTVWRPGGEETSHSLSVGADDQSVHADIEL